MTRYSQSQIQEQKDTWEECKRIFKGRCAWHIFHRADAIHEIEPRSYRPSDWWELENRIPLCTEIHTRIHEEGWHNWVSRLKEQRKRALRIISPEWVDEMEKENETNTEVFDETIAEEINQIE